MACLTFLLGTIHAIAHLSGTYRHGLHHPEALSFQISKNSLTHLPKSYVDFLNWRASWTGLVSLGICVLLSITGCQEFENAPLSCSK